MTSSQKIAVNTLATFARSLFGMALGLFSSRWVLHALGPVDFGLMGVVGALITFVAFLNGVTSVAVTRFLAFSIGQGDSAEINKWFNTALSVHTLIPLALVAAGWPLGEWAINHFLNIPAARLATACWVFRFSLILSFWGMCSTPYMGMFTAKQHIAEMSLWGVASTIANFGLAYYLTFYRGDAWLLYSGVTVAIGVGIGVLQVLRAQALFPECRIRLALWWDWSRVRQVLSFSGWSLFGGLGWLLRSQGIAILLNKYFNPAAFPHVNASYGVASQVSGQTQMLSGAMLGAFTPEIVASEGRGDRDMVVRHTLRASKFATYLTLLFALPLGLEIDYILALWLKSPPLLSSEFCRMMLLVFAISRLTAGYGAAISATGKIAGYQVSLGGLAILSVPVIWWLFAAGLGPLSLCWVFIGFMVVCTAGEAAWGYVLLRIPLTRWCRSVVIPCLTCSAAVLGIGAGVRLLFGGPSFGRFVCVAGAAGLASLSLGACVILDKEERAGVLVQLKRVCAKLGLPWPDASPRS